MGKAEAGGGPGIKDMGKLDKLHVLEGFSS